MAKQKDQHYAPKCLLKNFSTDGKVFLYNVTKDAVIDRAVPYDSQCQSDYLYGKDGEWETWLSHYEDAVAPVFRAIIRGETISKKQEMILKKYMVIQHMRTVRTIDTTKRMLVEAHEKMIPIVAQFYGINVNKENAREFAKQELAKHKQEEFAKQDMKTAKNGLSLFNDLTMKIAVSEESEFVCSDHPVLLFNPFQSQYGIGLGVAGLIVIMPVSPKYSIILYDHGIYEYSEEILFVMKSEKVSLLNQEQYLHCKTLLVSDKKGILKNIQNDVWRKANSFIANTLREKGFYDPIWLNRQITTIKDQCKKRGEPIIPRQFVQSEFHELDKMRIRDTFVPYKNNINAIFFRKQARNKYGLRGELLGSEYKKALNIYYETK